jgi:methyl-accepting chemotaxis protein
MSKNELDNLFMSLQESTQRMKLAAERIREANDKQAESLRKLKEAAERLRKANQELRESLENNNSTDVTLN